MPWKIKRRKKLIVILSITMTVLLLVLLGLIGWLSGWFDPPLISVNVGQPGAASGDAAEYKVSKPVADALQARTIQLLQNGNSGMLAAAHRLAGRYGQPPAESSEQFMALDQLLLGTYLLEQGWQEDFQSWWSRFAAAFLSADGLVRVEIGQDDQAMLAAGDFWRVNLAALRLLAQSGTTWPDAGRQTALLRLSGELLDLINHQGIANDFDAILPTPAPTLDPAATPTPKPTATPAITEPGLTMPVLRLASLDLFTMQSCAGLDNRWQTVYEKYLPAVAGGYINDDLPLYAFGYLEEENDYLSYSGATPSINTEESLLVILHLCEINKENPRSLNWLRNQLYNQRAIYESYHIAQGQPTSAQECVAGYAIIARIARIKGDKDLYDAAVQRLLWHQATSQTSAARSAIFREDADGMIHVYARDNTMALLAMR